MGRRLGMSRQYASRNDSRTSKGLESGLGGKLTLQGSWAGCQVRSTRYSNLLLHSPDPSCADGKIGSR